MLEGADLTESRDPERLRIGVTGHRQAALVGVDESRLRMTARSVLEALRDLTIDRPIEIISSLADGSDQLVAEEALALGYGLVAPLPFPPDIYAQDFRGDWSRSRFHSLLERASASDTVAATRASLEDETVAYAEAGERVLDFADLLLAIWDGQPARGRGGTAEIVAGARQRRVPVIWISSAPPHAVVGLLPENHPTSTARLVRAVVNRVAGAGVQS